MIHSKLTLVDGAEKPQLSSVGICSLWDGTGCHILSAACYVWDRHPKNRQVNRETNSNSKCAFTAAHILGQSDGKYSAFRQKNYSHGYQLSTEILSNGQCGLLCLLFPYRQNLQPQANSYSRYWKILTKNQTKTHITVHGFVEFGLRLED